MSNGNDPNTLNDPWNREQVPFESAAEGAATAAASAEAGAVSGDFAAGAASAGSESVPFQAAASGPAAGAPPPGGWGPVTAGYAPPPPSPIMGGVIVTGNEPSPALAFWLGLIPGVGAMYNGQVAKGIVHLVVFAVLVTLARNVNDIFGIFVTGWIVFMGFEAYHTAKARRDGLPLPNAFGWNDIGERMGLGKNWPFGPGATVAGAGAGAAVPPAGTSMPTGGVNPGGWTSAPPAGVPPYAAPAYAPPYATQGVAPNWAGYVPPAAFAGAPPAGAGPMPGVGTMPPTGQGVPYAPVNTGAPYSPYTAVDVPPAASRLPVGAIWLIGLGVLFLLGQWTPLLQFSRVWVPSIILTGLAALLFARRMGWTGSSAARVAAGLPMGVRVASAIRTPGALLAIALLNGLHEAWVVRWYRSWPVLLIVVGVLMLVERLALRQATALNATSGASLNGGL